MKNKRFIFNIYVVNQAGVLMRITQVFSRRSFNIDSLAVSSASDSKFSHMTITALGEEEKIEQIVKHVRKLVDVIHCERACKKNIVKELAFIKIENLNSLVAFESIAKSYGAKVITESNDIAIAEITAESEKIDRFSADLQEFSIIEIRRSGSIAIKETKEIF